LGIYSIIHNPKEEVNQYFVDGLLKEGLQ